MQILYSVYKIKIVKSREAKGKNRKKRKIFEKSRGGCTLECKSPPVTFEIAMQPTLKYSLLKISEKVNKNSSESEVKIDLFPGN